MAERLPYRYYELDRGNAFPISDTRRLESGLSAIDLRALLDNAVRTPEDRVIGEVVERTDILSSLAPFHVALDYQTVYPKTVVDALGNMFQEYNVAFKPLVTANREHPSDYQYSLRPDGVPINRWVQIDMIGLPDAFLRAAAGASVSDVQTLLTKRTFEIENSLAMTQLLERVFQRKNEQTLFDREFRGSLDRLRAQHGKKIALLAVTEEKARDMWKSEFGRIDGYAVSDEGVRALTGFDKFFGPDEFAAYVAANEGKCDYLIFARTSEPRSRLKDPTSMPPSTILDDPYLRYVIKSNAITFNVDQPNLNAFDAAGINDTKEYMGPMGMAFHLLSEQDLGSKAFHAFLLDSGATQEQIDAQSVRVLVKPMKSSYGGFGQHRAELGNNKFLKDVRRGIRDRGPHVAQMELITPVLKDQNTGLSYTYIDRNFFSTDGYNVRFMGGFRSLMPMNTLEAEGGRVHGNKATVWAPIV